MYVGGVRVEEGGSRETWKAGEASEGMSREKVVRDVEATKEV